MNIDYSKCSHIVSQTRRNENCVVILHFVNNVVERVMFEILRKIFLWNVALFSSQPCIFWNKVLVDCFFSQFIEKKMKNELAEIAI